jgi:hypothetical protein
LREDGSSTPLTILSSTLLCAPFLAHADLKKEVGKKNGVETTAGTEMADENEEEPQEVWPKKGSFVFPNGGRYGWCPHTYLFNCSLSCPAVACSAVTFTIYCSFLSTSPILCALIA